MLVLSRRQGQAIVVGDNIVIRVVEIRGDHIRLGIDAPRSVAVHREEIAAEIRSENQAAGRIDRADIAALPLPQPNRRPTDGDGVDGDRGGGGADDAAGDAVPGGEETQAPR